MTPGAYNESYAVIGDAADRPVVMLTRPGASTWASLLQLKASTVNGARTYELIDLIFKTAKSSQCTDGDGTTADIGVYGGTYQWLP